VFGWLPRGTHDWRRFLRPEELAAMVEGAGLQVVDRMGMTYAPLSDRWSLDDRDLSANYLMTAIKG
jgi:2-polyprenyl-6-hydroxyphenyl methylase/3-demethylubiquinone-9 3-methyltransferase